MKFHACGDTIAINVGTKEAPISRLVCGVQEEGEEYCEYRERFFRALAESITGPFPPVSATFRYEPLEWGVYPRESKTVVIFTDESGDAVEMVTLEN